MCYSGYMDKRAGPACRQAGFTPEIIILLVAAVLVAGFFAWRFVQGRPSHPDTGFQFGKPSQKVGQVEWPALWGPAGQNCQNNPTVSFEASPVAINDITFVEPMGELKQGHIVPGDHIGINYKTTPTSIPVKVYAPADGVLVSVEKHPYTPPPGYPQNMRHYHIYLIHSCTLFTGFVHVTEFAPEILAASPELKTLDDKTISQTQNLMVNIPVKGGQVLGTAWSFGLLGMVTVDLNVTNKGYLKPESYNGENWRIHAVSPFEYFDEPLKSQVLAKNPRTAEPRGGKIDFDIDGKLVGNWFLEGSGGFRDISSTPKQCGNFPCPYWEGHLAFVYDYIDPGQLRISIGHNSGLATQTPYGAMGNSPDFKDVGVKNGLVKYELVALKDLSAERGYETEDPIIEISDETRLLGVMLVQMIDGGRIKAEVFPGKTPAEVSNFSSSARVYTR